MGSLLSISIYITESSSVEKKKSQYYTNYQSCNSWHEKLIPADLQLWLRAIEKA